MAAVQVARNEKISLRESVRFVWQRYISFLSAPLFPLLFVAFTWVCMAIVPPFPRIGPRGELGFEISKRAPASALTPPLVDPLKRTLPEEATNFPAKLLLLVVTNREDDPT